MILSARKSRHRAGTQLANHTASFPADWGFSPDQQEEMLSARNTGTEKFPFEFLAAGPQPIQGRTLL